MSRESANALYAVAKHYEALPPVVHTDDPRTLRSRVLAGERRPVSYERALHQAALWVALAVAIERAETNDFTSGDAA